jgi:hypothetical protein
LAKQTRQQEEQKKGSLGSTNVRKLWMDGWWTSNRETWHYKQIELTVLEFVTDQEAHSMLDIAHLWKRKVARLTAWVKGLHQNLWIYKLRRNFCSMVCGCSNQSFIAYLFLSVGTYDLPNSFE